MVLTFKSALPIFSVSNGLFSGGACQTHTDLLTTICFRCFTMNKKGIYWLVLSALILAGLYYFGNLFITQKVFAPWQDALSWVYAFALLAYLFFGFNALNRANQSRIDDALNSELEGLSTPPAVRSLMRSLRRRAASLRNAARFTLFLTFISIATGLYIFTTAGQIALKDSYSAQLSEQLRNASSDEMFAVGILQNMVYSGAFSTPQLQDEIKNTAKGIGDRAAQRDQAISRIEQAVSGKDTLYFFLSTITTRIGSVLLLIFLVQILLSVYRYSIRLETYYASRADALLLYDGSDREQLQQIISALSPERIDFDKPPTSPIEHAVEVVKEAGALRK